MEAEAEEHQKRREAQYQSLLAPSPIPQMVAPSPLTHVAASCEAADSSVSQYQIPVLPIEQQLQSSVPIPHETTVPPYADASSAMSELQNMGYDQVSGLTDSMLIICLTTMRKQVLPLFNF